MVSYILKENVLSDDELNLPDEGKVFKGNYIAIVKKYSYQNCWTDKLTVKRFRCQEQLNKFLNKYYPEFNYYQ